MRAKRLREAADGLAEVALEEFDDRDGEVERLGLVDDVLPRQLVRDEELGEIADDLGRRRDLDDIATLLPPWVSTPGQCHIGE